MSKQQITEIAVYNQNPERKNWPFLLGGLASLPICMGSNLPSTSFGGVGLQLSLEDLVDELPWILGQEEEQIVVMPGALESVTPFCRKK